MAARWDEEEARLEHSASQTRVRLGIDAALPRLGQVHLVGSAALHVMVARDIDLVVVVPQLGAKTLLAIAQLAAQLTVKPDVHAVTVRNETGSWNTDPDYPDGVYLFIECVDEAGHLWTLDIWFVDEPGRKPALQDVARRPTSHRPCHPSRHTCHHAGDRRTKNRWHPIARHRNL